MSDSSPRGEVATVKASRVPRRVMKRMSDAELRALDELRYSQPNPARRAELKLVLGWKRTRDETLGLATELLERGMILSAVAARLDVDTRYLGALLKREATAEIVPRKLAPLNGKSATNLQILTADSSRGELPAPASGFGSFAELDEWLERSRP